VSSPEKPQDGVEPRSVPAKAAYSRPRLQVYGDFRRITSAVGQTGTADGGGSNPNHFATRP
jgi:hypothetical protein